MPIMVGTPSSSQNFQFGGTFNSVLSRNKIIEKALKKVGGLADGEGMTAEQLADGIVALNNIVREEDVRERNPWAVSPIPTSLTLMANTARYTAGTGATNIPENILELLEVTYRSADGIDTPLTILDAAGYERLANKYEVGDPVAVYLQNHVRLASKEMHVWPILGAVNTQSIVTGTDSNPYKCIRSHTASSETRPITGASYLRYWESGGSSPSTWASDTLYTAPQLIRLKYARPLWDFDVASDNPDFPQAFGRYLIYRLAFDLADDYAISLDERRHLGMKAQEAWLNCFPTARREKTNSFKNKGRYM